MKMILGVLIACMLPSWAKEKPKASDVGAPQLVGVERNIFFEKRVDVGALQKELIVAGFAVKYIQCSVDNCKIVLPPNETKDPLPVVEKYVYVDPAEVRRKKMANLHALYDKWEAKTITPEEREELIKQTLGIVLGR